MLFYHQFDKDKADQQALRVKQKAAGGPAAEGTKRILSAGRRDSRRPRNDEATHADKEGIPAGIEGENHGDDYTRIFWDNGEMPAPPSRRNAILSAVFVTFLWSTSWVLIKVGLKSNIPPISFAGLRYGLAFLVLLPFVLLNRGRRTELLKLGRRDWLKLCLLGVLTYTLTQTAQYLGLAFLPAAMLSLLLNLSSPFVALTGAYTIGERPSLLQWAGILLTIFGVGFYFLPAAFTQAQWIGILAAMICLTGNVASPVMARQVNRTEAFSPLLITCVSMGAGSVLMIATGLMTQGLGSLSGQDWAIIAWLAVVNTALTFTLWNHSLRVLTAFESSIINNLMMPQIAILGYIFLKEDLAWKEIAGLALVGAGVLLVQLRRSHAIRQSELPAERAV